MSTLLEVRELTKTFVARRHIWGTVAERLHAVSGVDFAIDQGETLGLV